jgi:ABC-type multidrug transport system fused ATPase/permease subunit
MIDTVRKCILMLPHHLRWWWLAVPLMAVVTGLAEAGAAATVFGLIKIVSSPTEVDSIPIAARIAPLLPWQEPGNLILQFAMLVAIYHVAKNMLVIGTQYVRHKIAGESSASLASAMLRGYLFTPYPFHFRRHSADLIRNTTHSVRMVFITLGAAASVLSELLVGAGIIAVLLAAAPGVTLVTALVLGILVVLLVRWTRGIAERAGSGEHALNREMLQTLQQALGAIKEIKVLGRETFFYRAFARQQQEIVGLGYLGVTLQALPALLLETVFVCGALLVIALLTITGRVGSEGLPLLALFAYAGFRVTPMANRLTFRLSEIRTSGFSVDRLYEDYLLVTGHEVEEADGDAAARGVARNIVVEHVSYTYPGASSPALRDVSLAIRGGESIGFVGPTGAGKSTLVDIIIGLLPPSSGRVTIDGQELTSANARAWRRNVGYVPQSIVLLDDTLRRNIALGVPEAEIDEEAVQRALRLARLDDVVASRPDGLDTKVGERGVRLSGGERQRIGIARALYHDPDVLVLDEATSALDNVTESAIASAISALEGRKTVLIIAHRMSTVRNCDRLALLAGGRLVDCGTFEQLLAGSEEFRALVLAAESPAGSSVNPKEKIETTDEHGRAVQVPLLSRSLRRRLP